MPPKADGSPATSRFQMNRAPLKPDELYRLESGGEFASRFQMNRAPLKPSAPERSQAFAGLPLFPVPNEPGPIEARLGGWRTPLTPV